MNIRLYFSEQKNPCLYLWYTNGLRENGNNTLFMVKIGTRAEYKKIMGDRKQIGKDGCPFCDLENEKDAVLWK